MASKAGYFMAASKLWHTSLVSAGSPVLLEGKKKTTKQEIRHYAAPSLICSKSIQALDVGIQLHVRCGKLLTRMGFIFRWPRQPCKSLKCTDSWLPSVAGNAKFLLALCASPHPYICYPTSRLKNRITLSSWACQLYFSAGRVEALPTGSGVHTEF
jgi:hypothetical protein